MAIKVLGLCAIVVALTFLILGGCKVEIVVPNGGEVITESDSYICRSRQVCTIDVYDIFFDEKFVAIPDKRHTFAGWKKRHKGFCGGKKQPCHLSTTKFLGNDVLMAILESDNIFYLEPIFAKPGVDVSLNKTVDNAAPSGSEIINFTIEVTNIGQDTAHGAKVNDLLPSGMRIPKGFGTYTNTGAYSPETGQWFIGELPTGATEVLNMPAQINVSPQPNCVINTAAAIGSDSNNYNNVSSVAIRGPGVERCADLTTSRVYYSVWNRTCGGKTYLTYRFDVWNKGPEEARNVVLSLRETSSYRLPGFKFISDNCTDFECRWESIPGRIIRSVLAETTKFNNKQEREHSYNLSVTTTDEDYVDSNNVYTQTETIPRFNVPCPDYGLPPYS